jgi:peptidoglycan/LPS O-acetylase OafA/YrhL
VPGAATRVAAVDILRCVAVMLVLGRHLVADLSPWPPPLRHVLVTWRRGGWVGVDLFFVLSGFLVSGLLFREHVRYGTIRVGRFLARRGFKIYPAFYVFLVVSFLLAPRSVPRTIGAGFLSEALFVQNYGPALFSHTWSLAVEEHFYLFVAALLVVLYRLRPRDGDPFRLVPAVYLLMAGGMLAGRLLLATRLPEFDAKRQLYPSHLRMDSLMLGVCLSYLYHYRHERLAALVRGRGGILFGSGLLLLLPAFVFDLEATPFVYTWGLTLFALGSALLLVVPVMLEWAPSGRFATLLARLGSYSYSIYLWHTFVAFTVVQRPAVQLGLEPGSPPVVVAYLVLSLLVGTALSWAVERPMLRVRDQLLPSRGAPFAQSAEDARAAARFFP